MAILGAREASAIRHAAHVSWLHHHVIVEHACEPGARVSIVTGNGKKAHAADERPEALGVMSMAAALHVIIGIDGLESEGGAVSRRKKRH